jgi:hypothetical protein
MRFAILGCTLLALLAGCEGLPEASSTPGIGTGGAHGDQLEFTVEPAGAVAGGSMPSVAVSAVNSSGVTDTSFTGTISLTLGTNPAAGALGGITSVAATAGVAIFNGLTINNAGNGYTLTATASGLASVTSTPFDISP